jgi:polysaccharide biosynthesis protein PslF
MKLLLISVYPPFRAPEANHALHLSENLARAGMEVHVLCQEGSTSATHPKITLHPLMKNWSFNEISQVKKAIHLSQPDAVLLLYLGWIYGQSVMVTALPSIVARTKPGLPFITQFEAIESPNIKQPALAAMTRKLLRFITKGRFHKQYGTLLSESNIVISLSNPHREQLAKEYPGLTDKSIVLPPPPLIRVSQEDPLITRRKIRAKLDMDDDQFVFMFWGHIYPGKGLETLLIAFELVHREIPAARLMIVGGSLSVSSATESSAYYRMVRDLPGKLGIEDRVSWTGAFEWDSEKGSEFLRAADACILPFDWGVTLNNSTLAAAATHGLPIIATRTRGSPDPELKHGQDVYFCSPKDAAVLADAMKQLMQDPAFLEKLRNGSRQLAGKWHNWPSVAAKLKHLLAPAHEQDPSARPQGLSYLTIIPPKLNGAGCSLSKSGASPGRDDRPLVSVVLAAYNVQKYLSQSLDSLVHQTLPGVEIIAIDDASTDETRKILEQYSARHANLRVVALDKNVGLASVRNIGLQHSAGTHVMFLDGDDWADVHMCEILYEHARSGDADLVTASATVFFDNDLKTFAPLFDHFGRKKISAFAKRYCFNLLEEPAALLLEQTAWAKIYKRSFLIDNNIRFEDGFNSYEDMCFHVKCMLTAKRIKVVDDPVVYYRQSRPGQISAMTGKRKFQIFDIFRIIHKTVFESGAPDLIWAQIARLELKHFNWMLKDRVAKDERRAFITHIAACLREIPYSAWRHVGYWGINEAAKAVAMRRGWPGAYALAEKKSTAPSRLLCLSSRRALSGGIVLGEDHPNDKSSLPKVPDEAASTRDINEVVRAARTSPGSSSFPEINGVRFDVHRIRGQDILVSDSRNQTNITDAVWRTEHDHFLTQLCVFRDKDVVVYIGAQVGIGVMHLAKRFPSIRIYAVEPDKRKFKQLQLNIEVNNISNVHAVNLAVADFNGTTKLYSGPSDDEWTTINPQFARRRKSFMVQDVEVRAIWSLFEELGIKECRMLKISAWGSIKKILDSIPSSIRIDYLCGEVDGSDCNIGSLEVASWRHSRQHFWRVWKDGLNGRTWSALEQLPLGPFDSQHNATNLKARSRSTSARQKRVAKAGRRPARQQPSLS